MYKAEPNTTRNQPSERPFLVRNIETTQINRYCTVHAEAEAQARRLNKVFYPEMHTEDAAVEPVCPQSR